MKHLIIIGVGGFARELYWHAQDSFGYGTEWDLKGFLDGDVKLDEEEYAKLELPVVGDINGYEIQRDDVFICAVGEPKVKEKLVRQMLDRKAEFINLIHRRTNIHGNAKMGIGNILVPDTAVYDHAAVGSFVTINGGTGLGHDSFVGDYTSLMSDVDITGYARVGKRVFIGSGGKVMPHSIIEDDAYVGVGSVVFKRVKAGRRVFGNPALPL